jgi:sugar phosphate isomerase/epimerase
VSAYRYSWSNFVNGDEPLQATLARLAEAGYDGIEIIGEPTRYDAAETAALVSSSGLEVSSIGAIYSGDRDFASSDPAVRANALVYVQEIVEMAAALGAPLAIFAPAACMRTVREASAEQEKEWMLAGMTAAGEYARSAGINLAIEAWNRYETYCLNRLDQAAELAREIALPNVGVMADVFHMNLEEDSIEAAIARVGPLLMHVHLADSNRSVPGSGHLDFERILRALVDVEYSGYLTFELIPAAADPLAVLASGKAEEFRTSFIPDAIQHLKLVEQGVSQSVLT